MRKQIIILGAGFGGVETARTLLARGHDEAEVTIISKKPYFEYYPGLYRVLSSEPPFEVFVPLHRILPERMANVIINEVSHIDLEQRKIFLQDGEIREYDILVLALGSEAFYFNIPGIETYALGCKSLVDVRYLRRDLISKINRMHDEKTGLHVVIAGGGPTGVEMSGQLRALFRDESRFQDIDCSKLKLTLIQSDERLTPQVPEKIGKRIKERLKSIDVEVLTGTKIIEQKEEGIITTKGEIATDTLIWTAGTQINKVIQNIPGLTFTPRKKVAVDSYLRAQGQSNVYVIGDAADTQYSGLAQTAVSNGAYVGRLIRRELEGKKVKPYVPAHSPAYVMPVGRYWGIFYFKGFMLTGLIPHMMRYSVDIFYFFRRLRFTHFLTLYIRGRLK